MLRVDPALHLHVDRDEETGRRGLVVDQLDATTRFRLPSPALLRALDAARDWIGTQAYLARLGELGLDPARARRFLADALEHGLLQRGEPARWRDGDARALRWSRAGCSAAYALLRAKAAQRYLDYGAPEAEAAEAALMAAYRAESAPPPACKAGDPAAVVVPLGDPAAAPALGGLAAAAGPPVARELGLAWLAALLRHAFGVTGALHDPVQGELLLKTHPSGGARHPLECYVAARAVRGLAAGPYHYAPREHALRRLAGGAAASDALAASCFPALAPDVVVVLALRPERAMWRYREPTSFNVMLLDLGHALENFALVCRAERVAHASALELPVAEVAHRLGLPAYGELPLAALAAGTRPGGAR